MPAKIDRIFGETGDQVFCKGWAGKLNNDWDVRGVTADFEACAEIAVDTSTQSIFVMFDDASLQSLRNGFPGRGREHFR
jgi:hypothetical protein